MAMPVIAEFGGKVLARVMLTGMKAASGVVMIIEFESKAGREIHFSDAYQAAKAAVIAVPTDLMIEGAE